MIFQIRIIPMNAVVLFFSVVTIVVLHELVIVLKRIFQLRYDCGKRFFNERKDVSLFFWRRYATVFIKTLATFQIKVSCQRSTSRFRIYGNVLNSPNKRLEMTLFLSQKSEVSLLLLLSSLPILEYNLVFLGFFLSILS